MTGTSFATPAISGLCALLLGAYPGLQPYEVKSVLRAKARPPARTRCLKARGNFPVLCGFVHTGVNFSCLDGRVPGRVERPIAH